MRYQRPAAFRQLHRLRSVCKSATVPLMLLRARRIARSRRTRRRTGPSSSWVSFPPARRLFGDVKAVAATTLDPRLRGVDSRAGVRAAKAAHTRRKSAHLALTHAAALRLGLGGRWRRRFFFALATLPLLRRQAPQQRKAATFGLVALALGRAVELLEGVLAEHFCAFELESF